MQYCGYSVKMGYSTSFSSAWITSIRPAMIKYFGYDPDMQYVERFNFTVNQWNDMMYNELREGRPVIYGAMTPEGSGHCFIIDGYEKGDFFHINWGWSGMSDGFYRLPELHPASAGLGGASGGTPIISKPLSVFSQMTMRIPHHRLSNASCRYL